LIPAAAAACRGASATRTRDGATPATRAGPPAAGPTHTGMVPARADPTDGPAAPSAAPAARRGAPPRPPATVTVAAPAAGHDTAGRRHRRITGTATLRARTGCTGTSRAARTGRGTAGPNWPPPGTGSLIPASNGTTATTATTAAHRDRRNTPEQPARPRGEQNQATITHAFQPVSGRGPKSPAGAATGQQTPAGQSMAS